MSANRVEIVKTVIAALQSGDTEVAAAKLADSFTMTGFVTRALNKGQFLSFQDELLAAMPDLSYNLDNVVRTQEANTVSASVILTGTHTHDLELPQFGLEKIAATGIDVSLPQTTLICHVEHDQLTRAEFENVTGGGLVGLLQQLGSELPLLQDELNEPDGENGDGTE
ncbi:nuclear transport factor 2 family protein [Dictyobacter kobayashii]|uniref:SnoaL-like domain-containing protein n=1 Tax=Dictyobacter kobayashii TaxID=2014872 RepID=A0A402AJQ4_9CHLR|nr:nuclear transport factor 2 family protein [Dictyobacter kobayashii]GCE19351.1 hypothetical protein KDK_31510 [Dictyobacter kobayashii]